MAILKLLVYKLKNPNHHFTLRGNLVIRYFDTETVEQRRLRIQRKLRIRQAISGNPTNNQNMPDKDAL